MNIIEAIAVNSLLKSLANVDGVSWETMEAAGRMLAGRAHKVLLAGYDANSFSRALARGQGLARSTPKRRGKS